MIQSAVNIDTVLYRSCETYVNYYIQSRLDRDCQLVCSGDCNISELCSRCGFFCKDEFE